MITGTRTRILPCPERSVSRESGLTPLPFAVTRHRGQPPWVTVASGGEFTNTVAGHTETAGEDNDGHDPRNFPRNILRRTVNPWAFHVSRALTVDKLK